MRFIFCFTTTTTQKKRDHSNILEIWLNLIGFCHACVNQLTIICKWDISIFITTDAIHMPNLLHLTCLYLASIQAYQISFVLDSCIILIDIVNCNTGQYSHCRDLFFIEELILSFLRRFHLCVKVSVYISQQLVSAYQLVWILMNHYGIEWGEKKKPFNDLVSVHFS